MLYVSRTLYGFHVNYTNTLEKIPDYLYFILSVNKKYYNLAIIFFLTDILEIFY